MLVDLFQGFKVFVPFGNVSDNVHWRLRMGMAQSVHQVQTVCYVEKRLEEELDEEPCDSEMRSRQGTGAQAT